MVVKGMATTYRVRSLDLDRFQFLLLLKRLVLASVTRLLLLLLLDLGHGEMGVEGAGQKKKIISGRGEKQVDFKSR